jgi:hypothetical protein
MTRFVEHSDNFLSPAPAPLRGWYISNDDGEPVDGPYATKSEAEYELQEMDGSDPDRLRDDAEDRHFIRPISEQMAERLRDEYEDLKYGWDTP